ncbi:MAG: AMP-binding protein [Odoribacter sp.]
MLIPDKTFISAPSPLSPKVDEQLQAFLREWFDDKPYVIAHTSGSTGIPKEIHLSKADMRASADITNAFFGINTRSVLLLCLSVDYIAGKMMVVRALQAGAELITVNPSSHPLHDNKRPIDLAAMVPLQVEETLHQEPGCISAVRQLLIGGAPLPPTVEHCLKTISTSCYATYGMTETVSHVALRKLNDTPLYTALANIHFTTDNRGCLIIHTPHLSTPYFVTNDLVSLVDSRHFEWFGRFDNVINSGSIKLFPEIIEHKMAPFITSRFFLTTLPDLRLGERLILAIEISDPDPFSITLLANHLRSLLEPYEMPKEIHCFSHFRETENNKIIRDINKLKALYIYRPQHLPAGGKN